ncbi:nuclear factor NF-kappa-B p100 subunit [Pristis pectinata]|uniref:nuclear factor NF-kappa-B p100 subunit n=1 Tax=Pristis pectinata TaxID=685728 RepID=UPI00223E531C|nr:nuclear factor NF-kappa-B p100 subunit [Pristis pectinata]XP_051897530.1 nuclear factor NF-kappa-B p100 subunit [Pristis pectinata]XP_051897531.1 nuclear factor NF-kappa-B p100 subunit [Pristis pectinata]
MEDAYNLGTQDADSDFGQLDLNVLTSSEASLVSAGGPFIAICEQPKQRGFRFRYGCEGPSHGGLPGASSEKNRKTYPSVKIFNYTGNAKVVVQLVTAKDPPRLHAHSLVGKQCTEDGVCIVQVGPKDMTAQFTNLGILHVTKKNVPEVLLDRIFNEMYQKNPLNPKNFISKSLLSQQELQHLRQESEQLAKEMDLSVVRLQFTAYLPDGEGMYTLPLEPVISDPIFDSKAPNASNLKIVRMDKTSGCVLGGDEIYLLCDKVQKDDIQIRFYEDDEHGWEAYGDFGPTDVHRQFAIVFRTPRYWNISIERPITVFVQLKRRKDGETSEAKAFTYCPRVEDREEVNRKRLKRLPHFSDHFGGGGPSGGSPGIGGGGAGSGGGGFNFLNYANSFGAPLWPNQQGMQHTGGSQGVMELPLEQSSQQSLQDSDRSPGEVQQVTDQHVHLAQSEQLLGLRALQITERTARALLDYAITADVRMLLAVQRHLTAIQDENGDTSLHLAIIHQKPLVVQQLLQVIISIPWQNIINVPNHLRQTPLHLGVITQQHKMVDLLLAAGADAAILDRHGNSILHLALHRKDEQMVLLLLQQLKPQVLNKLIKLPDCDGLYPVHLAVKALSEELVDLLLNKGAERNVAEQKSGRTPLHLAVEMRSLRLVGHLVDSGVEVDVPTFQGNTALHLAAGYGFPELVAMLLGAGADRNAENYEPVLDPDEEDDPDLGICRGHTPLDITSDQKVRDILLEESWKWKEQNEKSSEVQQGSIASLGSEALGELNKVLNQEVSGVGWMKLAEKLDLGSLTELFKSAKSPSKSLLDNFDISGGTIEQLINALQQLGLEKAVNIIQKTEIYKVLQSSDGKQSVDSAYESESQKDISAQDNLANRAQISDHLV